MAERHQATLPAATGTFKLKADWQPAGDQPQAIEGLVSGLQDGLSHQTLLGVTGSGKSVGYEDPVFVAEQTEQGLRVIIRPAGEFIDELMTEARIGDAETDTDSLLPSGRQFFTYALDPESGDTRLFPVSAFLRHKAPGQMFRIASRCGRVATLTGDHNLWILRGGKLTLVRTQDVRPGDHLPVPREITYPVESRPLDVVHALRNAQLFVHAEDMLEEFEAFHGRKPLAAAMQAVGINAPTKLLAIRRRIRGSGILARDYLALIGALGAMGGVGVEVSNSIGGKRKHNRLPVRMQMSAAWLRLVGFYVAEGNCQRGCILIANRHPELRRQIEESLASLGLPFGVRQCSDYQISSTALAKLLRTLCGATAAEKRLPPFWSELPDAELGTLLRAYFDGDGTVELKGQVSALTASEALASDLAYALLRFGIWGRIRKVFKRATNSNHAGDWYYDVALSGQPDLKRFQEKIGFGHPEKREALGRCLGRESNPNVDLIPIDGSELRALREGLGLTRKGLATLTGCSRPAISLIESGHRAPSHALFGRLLGALRERHQESGVQDMSWWRRWQGLNALRSLRWSAIQSVESVSYGHPYVYDLSVPGPETFLAGRGGFFVHNTYTIANVISQLQRPALVLAPNKTLAGQLYGEFKEFFPDNAVEYFVSYYDYYQPEAYMPSTDTYIEKDSSLNEHIEQMRLSATKAILERRDAIIVATVSAIYGLGDPQQYFQMVLHLVKNEKMDQRELLRRLTEMRYTRNEIEFSRSHYRVRGDVIDIHPAESDAEALRVELFDDVVESLTLFDPLTGELKRKLPRYTVFPATHYVTPREKVLAMMDSIKNEMRDRLVQLRGNNKLVEAQRLEQRTMFDLEMIREVGYCNGVENYSRYLSGRSAGQPPPTLFDYIPPDALLIVDESHVTVPQLGAMYKGDRSRKETLVEYGFRLPSALDNRPLRFDEFERISPQTIYVSATPGAFELQKSGRIVEQVVRPTGLVDPETEIRPAASQVDDLLGEIKLRVAKQERVLVTTLTKRMSEDLTDYLREHGVRVRYLHSDIDTVERAEIIRDLRLGTFDVLVGINLLREGLDLPEVSLVAILDADKEGFLRSDRALIQTIGRAARNLNGRAILYADRLTNSMQRAIAETDRRREKQRQHNIEHGITPVGIKKAVSDYLHAGYEELSAQKAQKAAEAAAGYAGISVEKLSKMITTLQKEMQSAAQDLDFETAAAKRDEIRRIREVLDKL